MATAQKDPSIDELMSLETAEGKPSEKELSAEEIMALPTEEPEEMAFEPPKGLGERALEKVSQVQAAVPAGLLPVAAKGISGIPAGFESAKEQLSAPAEEAPTMRQVMQVAGVPEAKIPIPTGEIGQAAAGTVPLPEQIPAEIPASEAAAQLATQYIDPFELGLKGAGLGIRGVKAITPEIVKTGAKVAAKTVMELPAVAKATMNSLVPEVRKEYVKHFQLANSTGIDPDLIRKNSELIYGKDSFVAKVEGLRRGLGEKEKLENFNNLTTQLSDAIDNQIAAVGKESFSGDRVTTGQALITGYDNAIKRLFDEAQIRYSNALEYAPEATISKGNIDKFVSRMQKLALEQERLIDISTDRNAIAEARENLFAINRVMDTVAKGDMGAVIEQMSQVGKDAFETPKRNLPGKQIAASQKVKKAIYGELKDSVTSAFEEANTDIANALKDSNLKQSEFFKRNKFISDVIDKEGIAPEKVYERLIAFGDSNQLSALKDIFTQYGQTQALDAAKSQFLFETLARNAEQTPLYAQTLKKMEQDPRLKRVLGSMFAPDELTTLKDLLRLGVDLGAKQINSSQSGVLGTLAAVFSRGSAGLKDLAAGATAATVSKKLLEGQAYRNYFKDMNVFQILNTKEFGMFDPELVDDVLAERMKDPATMVEFQKAKSANKLTPALVSQMEQNIKQSIIGAGAKRAWGEVYSFSKDQLAKAQNLIGMLPDSTPMQTYRILQTVARLQRDNTADDGEALPVMIPETEADSVRKAIMDSSMSSIQKAKNIKALNSSGYLLDIRPLGEMGRSSQVPFIPERKSSDLKIDKPDVLRNMTKRKPAQEGELYAAVEPQEVVIPEAPQSLDDLIKFYKEAGLSEDMAVMQSQKDLGISPELEGETEEGLSPTEAPEIFQRVSAILQAMQANRMRAR